MSEENEPSGDFKAAMVNWIAKSFSFVSMLICLLLGVFFTILQIPLIAPVEDNAIDVLIILNAVVCLITYNSIGAFMKSRAKRKSDA